METINLLPNKSRLQLRQMRVIQKLNLVAVGLLVGFSFVALGVFVSEFYLRRQVKKNQGELRKAKAEFGQFLDKIDELQNLRFRVKLVAETLKKRVTTTAHMTTVEEILGEEGSVEQLEINADELALKGNIPHLTALDKLEARLLAKEYQILKLESLNAAKESGLTFDLKVKPKEEASDER